MALFAYPRAEHYLDFVSGEQAPFVLKNKYLYQENVQLTDFEVKVKGDWKRLFSFEP